MDTALHLSHRITHLRRSAAVALCWITLVAFPSSAQIMQEHHTLRELSGTVTDPGHEPIRGAIVQLEDEGSHAIITYITEDDGRYHFKRLSGDQDYRVWVVFRKRNSRHHEISKFDDHLDKVINFTIEAF
jgi:hypothetical protein